MADFNELRDHEFFADINWNDLVEKRTPPPWIPDLESRTDLRHIDPEFTREQVPASLGHSLVANSYINSTDFNGFTYVNQSNLI